MLKESIRTFADHRTATTDEGGCNRLFVIDDDTDVLDFVQRVATALGYRVKTATDAETLLASMAAFDPTLIMVDLQMPRMDGIALLRELGRRHCRAPVAIASGMDARVLAGAEQFGLSVGLDIVAALGKPVMLDVLEELLIRQRQTEQWLDPKELGRAVDRGQLVVHYQPKAELRSDGWLISGVEALLRWQHPEFGLVYPDRFIPLAEAHGLVGAMTDWVLQTGVAEIAEWRGAGLNVRLAVNVSAGLVDDIEFPDRLAALLAAQGVDNSQLTIEITETAALTQPSRTLDILTRLRVKGFGLSLDDFGTGYSSLTQLYRMPFNEIKIDKSLGLVLGHDREAQTMVRSMVDLAHNLGMKVCAEGVEVPAALQFLERVGCDFAQGYLLARPMPAAEVRALLGTVTASQRLHAVG
jgi:EAL domain-containing protein (putative c-di-GMP-specific phosphodiesterase class I)/ActR/RegA family two-component response regulator